MALRREADELHLAAEHAQDPEQVLGLLDVAAKVVLGVEDQQRVLISVAYVVGEYLR